MCVAVKDCDHSGSCIVAAGSDSTHADNRTDFKQEVSAVEIADEPTAAISAVNGRFQRPESWRKAA